MFSKPVEPALKGPLGWFLLGPIYTDGSFLPLTCNTSASSTESCQGPVFHCSHPVPLRSCVCLWRPALRSDLFPSAQSLSLVPGLTSFRSNPWILAGLLQDPREGGRGPVPTGPHLTLCRCRLPCWGTGWWGDRRVSLLPWGVWRGEQLVGQSQASDTAWPRTMRAPCARQRDEKRTATRSWSRPSEITPAGCEKHIPRGVSACENKRDFTVLKHTFFSPHRR